MKREDKRDTSTDCYERIWVVVDVDDFHDHGEAARICKDNGIELIISNPCFEVWLLDHVKACPSSYTLTPDVESAAAEAKVVGGNRNKYINTELIDKEHLDAAIRNAARHNTAENSQGRNRLTPHHEQEYVPWTDMPKVIETLKSNKQS
uniref:RloB family protein n=1 Tax=Bifidobacterium adolescentis TaxID=1680 RepID=UPI00402A3848